MPSKHVIRVSAPGMGVLEKVIDRSPFVIGRDATCDLVLAYPFISKRQLVLEEQNGGWSARAEGRNHVLIDGERLDSPRRIAEGTKIALGPINAIFDVLDAPEGDFVTMELSFASLVAGRRDRLAILAELSAVLAGSSDERAVAARGAEVLREALAARSAAVVELEGARISMLASAGADPTRLEPTWIDRAKNTAIAIEEGGPRLLAPLGAPARGLIHADRARAFTEDEVTFTTVLAHLLGAAIGAARERRQLDASRERLLLERVELLRDIERRGRFGTLVGASAEMKKVAQAIAKVAPTETTVLILGETGTGKELVAREVHHRSARAERPFFALNCAALPESLIESELFGHQKGAFSGADADRAGIFEIADGGTVFLDEIGELPLVAQAKVLRVLDAREIQPLGGGMPKKVDVRIVAATHRDLEGEIEGGRFRRDLLYRLKVFSIGLPALRERKSDVRGLVEHFLADNPEAKRKRIGAPTAEAVELLEGHSWPGNVRQLAHVIEQMVILAEEDETLDVVHLPAEIADNAVRPIGQVSTRTGGGEVSLRDAVADFERAFIVRELEHDGWNRTLTARRLQIPLRSFMDRLKRLDIRGPR